MPARDGAAYLKGLRATNREIWLGDEQVEDVVGELWGYVEMTRSALVAAHTNHTTWEGCSAAVT